MVRSRCDIMFQESCEVPFGDRPIRWNHETKPHGKITVRVDETKRTIHVGRVDLRLGPHFQPPAIEWRTGNSMLLFRGPGQNYLPICVMWVPYLIQDNRHNYDYSLSFGGATYAYYGQWCSFGGLVFEMVRMRFLDVQEES